MLQIVYAREILKIIFQVNPYAVFVGDYENLRVRL